MGNFVHRAGVLIEGCVALAARGGGLVNRRGVTRRNRLRVRAQGFLVGVGGSHHTVSLPQDEWPGMGASINDGMRLLEVKIACIRPAGYPGVYRLPRHGAGLTAWLSPYKTRHRTNGSQAPNPKLGPHAQRNSAKAAG